MHVAAPADLVDKYLKEYSDFEVQALFHECAKGPPGSIDIVKVRPTCDLLLANVCTLCMYVSLFSFGSRFYTVATSHTNVLDVHRLACLILLWARAFKLSSPGVCPAPAVLWRVMARG